MVEVIVRLIVGVVGVSGMAIGGHRIVGGRSVGMFKCVLGASLKNLRTQNYFIEEVECSEISESVGGE